MRKVLVLGAGVGGLVAANSLAQGYEVTVVEKKDTHLFQPGLLFIAFAGEPASAHLRPVRELLDPRVRLVRDEVKRIDLGERLVETRDGKKLSYDILVVALGASYDYSAVPGHREAYERFGDYYSTPEAAEKLRRSLSSLRRGTFLVAAADPAYKCPPAPHKGAMLASRYLRSIGSEARVVLAVPFVHAYPSPKVSEAVEAALERSNVELATMFTLDSIDIGAGKAESLEGETLSFDAIAVIPPHRGPAVAVSPAEAVDEDGYFKVDKEKLNVSGYDDAFAVGDCSNAPTSKSGVTAHLAAEVVADRIRGLDSRFTGRTNCPIIADGEAAFVISDYGHPALPVRFSRFKRLLEDLFIEAYWSTLRYPERWRPLFSSYFRATSPEALGERGW